MIKSLIPGFIWLLIITLLSTRASVPMPKFDLLASDKLGHALAYGLLMWLVLLGFSRREAPASRRFGYELGAFLFAAGYGMLMEFVQANFFPGRFFEYDDMLANAVGAALGWLIFVRLFPTHDPKFMHNALNRMTKNANRKS